MPVDLDKIRALLASVAGFTPGPWRVSDPDPVAPTISGQWRVAVVTGDDDGRPWDDEIEPGPGPMADARLIAAAPDLHRELTEAVGEIERLRAHNARMVAQIGALADACEAAMSSEDGPLVVCDALPGRRWSECSTALRRLAAGEVDDALDEVPDVR